MNLSNMDTPMLREEYTKVRKEALKLMRSGATTKDFNVFVEDELVFQEADKNPRNYVVAALECLKTLQDIERHVRYEEQMVANDVTFYED